MKTCPVCEVDLDDSYLFCPEDGSSLDAQPAKPVVDLSLNPAAGDCTSANARPESVVLYCPKCAAEYPLTFSACPVHGAELVRHRVPRSVNPASDATVKDRLDSTTSKRITSLKLERPQIDRSPTTLTATVENTYTITPPLEEASQNGAEDLHEFEASRASSSPFFSHAFPTLDQQPDTERPGFRIAAIATIVALSMLGLVVSYRFVASLSRRRPAPAVQVASQSEPAIQALPFVPTPQEAQDYKEPPVAPSEPITATDQPVELLNHTKNVQRESDARKPATSSHSPTLSTSVPSTAATPRMATVSTAPLPPLPQGDAGGFDARLVRVRSNRTGSGVRYDLTFNMQEQAGRSALWQRLLISTRAASGMSHTQAIPFVHRLGATGALTFTISVEMSGRSEADWQGRVVCTTLGWDNNDRPLQASFGANVTP